MTVALYNIISKERINYLILLNVVAFVVCPAFVRLLLEHRNPNLKEQPLHPSAVYV